MRIDRHAFFAQVRTSLFSGALATGQVAGLNALLDGWEQRHPAGDVRWLAYGLATAYHETGRCLQPVRERGSASYCENRYGIAGRYPARARRLGNTRPGDGDRYRGRGFAQLTFKANYAAMAAHLGRVRGQPVDLVGSPELACRLDLAVEFLFYGMESGAFTGRSLADCFSRDAAGRIRRDDWIGARAIINGRDRAALVAGYGRAFLAALGEG